MRRILLVLLAGCAGGAPPERPGSDWTTISAPGETVQVYRDGFGIPHIFARTLPGAFYAQGFLQALDRSQQMDTFRRAAQGQAAEVRGPGALANDRDRRRRGYTPAELEELFDSCQPRTREAFRALALGVNAAGREPGSPFAPGARPWTVTDSIAIAVMMARRFGEAGDTELMVSRIQDQLVRRVGAEAAERILSDLLRIGDPWAPTTLGDEEREPPRPPTEKGWLPTPGMSDEADAQYRRELQEIFRSREFLGVPSYFGSNAWAVAPGHSATGRAMLYGGPMMGFGAPSVCCEVHLVAPGLNSAGMSFPGIPGVMIGWNEHLAWTTTSGGADLVDVYSLELNPENPDEYRHGGQWKKFEIRESPIRIQGEATENLLVYRSIYGPLAGELDRKSRRAYALKMAFWMKESGTIDAVIDINFAGTVEEFRDAVSRITTSHNFLCATDRGHIGFWYCGAHPIRKKGHDGTRLVPGDGTMDWEGSLPFKDWPQAIDPPQGYLGNWNNKPSRSWPSVGWGRIFWGKKILDVLSSEPKLSLERVEEIARLTAYHAYLADYFKPVILGACQGSDDPELKHAAEVLRAWDDMEVEGAPGPTLIERWVQAAMRRLFGEYTDPLLLGTREVQRVLVDPLLSALEPPPPGRPNRFDYAKGRDLRALVLDSLREAIKPGWGALGWKEPSIDFQGELGSVKSKRGRGTFQMAIEMVPGAPRAFTLAAPGQSEDARSPHSKDQMGLFQAWKLKSFVYRREEMK